MKTSLELNGWSIERTIYPRHFHLFIRGFRGPVAGGSLGYLATALKKFLGD